MAAERLMAALVNTHVEGHVNSLVVVVIKELHNV